MNENLDVSIVIVSWNCWGYLKECLDSIYSTIKNIHYEIIIIDNNSSDNTVSEIERLFNHVTLIQLKENLGFPAANNLGFERARGKYILCLNPDTKLLENSVERPVGFLEKNNDYGCIGIKQLKPNLTINFQGGRKFPTLRGFVSTFLYLDKIFPFIKVLNSPDMTYWNHQNSEDVQMLSGAYILFPKSLYVRIGGFDTSQSMYYEDMEFCYRVIHNGYKIRYISEVGFIHFTNKSSDKANKYWVSSLTYEAFYKFIRINQGQLFSLMYLVLLLIIAPIRLLLIPFLTIAIYLKNNDIRFKSLLSDTGNAIFWTIRKLISFGHYSVS